MKKLFGLFVVSIFALLLIGCNKSSSTTTTAVTTTTNTGTTGSTATTKPEKHYDFGGADFLIVANDPTTADPRNDRYSGLYQLEKQELITKAEQKYNIKVKFVAYPSQASWGQARENWIIQDVISGNPTGQIYQISTSSIPTLAKGGAILPLKGLIDEYGSPQFYESKKLFGKFLDEYYVYDDSYPINNDGLYYNEDLLQQLGYEKDYPTKLWNEGKWNWAAFESLCKELNSKLDENAGQFPIGGRTYNYAYNFIAANGGTMVDDQLNVNVANPENIAAMDFLASLYAIPGMWLDDASLSNAVQIQFNEGKIVFQDGQYWFAFTKGKFADRSFTNLGFVPYPTGPNTAADLSNYYNVGIWGAAAYVISTAYDPSKIPAGYEDMFYSNESIFKIWNDLQYFGDENDYKIDFSIELAKYYADMASVDAHLSVIDKTHNDLLYAFGADAFGQVEGSYMMLMEKAIREDNVRASMEALKPVIELKAEALKGN